MSRKRRKPLLPERARIGRTVLAVTADTAAFERGLQSAAQSIQAAEPPSAFRIEGDSGPLELLADDSPPTDGKPKLKRFTMTAYTGGAMRLSGFYWPVVVDLAGVSEPTQTGPIFKNHDPDKIVGHWDKAETSAQRIKIAGTISGVGPDAQEVLALAGNGFPWQASVGMSAQRMEFVDKDEKVTVNGKAFTGPIYVARATTLGEVSFVPRGADSATSATVAASSGAIPMKFNQWLRAKGHIKSQLTAARREELRAEYLKEHPPTNDPPAPTPPDPPAPVDAGAVFRAEMERLNAEARLAAAAELARTQAIAVVCAPEPSATIEVEANGARSQVNLQQHAVRSGWTADHTELQLRRLQSLRAARPQGPFGYSITPPQVDEAVLEAAVFHATRHQLALNNDDFYHETMPNGHGGVIVMNRVPAALASQVRAGFAADYGDQVQQAAHTLFRGNVSMMQLMVMAGRQHGYNGPEVVRDQFGVETLMRAQNWTLGRPGMPGRRIAAEGSSTMSLANVLANVQNKFMLQGYLFVEQVWRQICGVRPVNDFKPTKSINLLGDTEFKPLGRNGEIENATLNDQAFANQAFPFARMLTIPWTNLVDDDLSILSTAPMKVGTGAGLALNKLVWATWMNPGNGDDGSTFFLSTARATPTGPGLVAANPNALSAGASSALSSTSLNTAKVLFDNQVDPNGNPLGFDGARPILLFPPDLWQVAMELVDPAAIGLVLGAASTTRQPNVNLWKGRFEPAMSRYLNKTFTTSGGLTATGSTTAWYILFNPVALAAIEVCFLGGVDVPVVQQAGPDFQFDRLGLSMRGTMPFGVTMQNFRATVRSPGA